MSKGLASLGGINELDTATNTLVGPTLTGETPAQKQVRKMRRALCGHIKVDKERRECESRVWTHAGRRTRRRTRRRGARSSRARPTR
jgi:hypothetical protein